MNNPVIQGPEITSMILSMLVVVAAVIALGWLYSRLRFTGGGAANVINVVASRGLGPKERLLLVEVGGQQLLVGMTASSVQTLHTFDRPIAAEAVTAAASRDAFGFADRLRTVVRGHAK
ncbi:MAG: flagellar biosynthetic protein FliO [Gammaproteobacteria bacterium]|nr:flagellar biosynthetic protein FliO [Gammaproteobacteria bacterium]